LEQKLKKFILEKLKESQKDAKFVLYLWDSIKNYKGKHELLPYFDKAFSFDSSDVKKYKGLIFLPLFYIPAYEKTTKSEIKYDLCFIGSGHSDRYKIISNIKRKSSELGLSVFCFLFLHSKIVFLFRKYFDKRMNNANIKEFSFFSLTQQEAIDIISQSNVVLDIEHPGQVGLTMRTIEMVGCEKKLITTNQSIKDYDFYNENNIYIMDRVDPEINKTFFLVPYQKLNNYIYNKYSLNNWLETIFSEN